MSPLHRRLHFTASPTLVVQWAMCLHGFSCFAALHNLLFHWMPGGRSPGLSHAAVAPLDIKALPFASPALQELKFLLRSVMIILHCRHPCLTRTPCFCCQAERRNDHVCSLGLTLSLENAQRQEAPSVFPWRAAALSSGSLGRVGFFSGYLL